MLDLRTPLEPGVEAPEPVNTDVLVQTTAPLQLRNELRAAAKAVEIAQQQEQQVGARRKDAGGLPQKYVLSDEGRALILARYDSQTTTISWLAEQLSTPEHSIPRWQVRKWARDLGIARVKEPHWSEEEVAYLRNSVRRHGLKKIAKALGRTETSVKLKAKRLGIRKLITGDGFTMRAVCRGLNVDHHQVERWLTNGWFWGERRESRRHGRQGDIWYFTAEAIRLLVRQHREEIDLRRVDRDFFIEVLLGPPEEDVSARPAPGSPRQAARSIYAYMSDEAHTLLVTHYTGGLRRTEALAEILRVTTDEVTTWAVVLGLEDASLHHPHVHQQRKGGQALKERAADSSMSQSVRHLLETRFNGDPGTTEALADDLGIPVEAVFALAQDAGLQVERRPGDGESSGAQGTRRGRRQKQEPPREDRIPLQVQLLIAMRYHDEDADLSQLAEELTGMLPGSEAPITVGQVDAWARLLGLRSRRRRGRAQASRTSVDARSHRPATPVTLPALQLGASEWANFLSSDALQKLSLADEGPALSTVEEIQLGHQVSLGTEEQNKPQGAQDPDLIAGARHAEERLAAACLPLLFQQALIHLGQGVSLEALLAVGRCGLDEAIFRFDYADPYPLVSCALPAIIHEMELLIASTAAPHPEEQQMKRLRLYARIANESCLLAQRLGRPPTVEEVAAALSLAPEKAVKTIRALIEAQQHDEESNSEARRGRERVTDAHFREAFLKTKGLTSAAIIKELAEALPLTPLTIQVRFYEMRLHTRIVERDRRHEWVRQRIEANRMVQPLTLRRGPFLWDAVVDGQRQRWGLTEPYGTLAESLSSGRRLLYEGCFYETVRVYHNTLVVSTSEGAAPPDHS